MEEHYPPLLADMHTDGVRFDHRFNAGRTFDSRHKSALDIEFSSQDK